MTCDGYVDVGVVLVFDGALSDGSCNTRRVSGVSLLELSLQADGGRAGTGPGTERGGDVTMVKRSGAATTVEDKVRGTH